MSARSLGGAAGALRCRGRHFDGSLARLVATLRACRLWDTTVLILLSDHGEGFEPERGRIHHAGRLHEDLIRVPLLVRVPGLAPRTVDTPVSLVDVMPTLLDLLGVRARRGLDGISLARLLRSGTSPPEHALFAMSHAFRWTAQGRVEVDDVRAESLAVGVIRGHDWYIRRTDGEELYDMALDPGQRENRIADARDIGDLRALAESRGVGRPVIDRIAVEEPLHERLRALGYVR